MTFFALALYALILPRMLEAAGVNWESLRLAYCVLLSRMRILIGEPTKPNSLANELRTKCSKLSDKRFLRLTKRKKVGGRVLICIR